MELLKLLSANELVTQVISFLLLLVILRVFLWDKFLKALDARREKIAAELKAVEDAKADAAGVKASYDRMLGEIDAEAKERIAAAALEGRKVADELRLKAEKETERLFEKAKESIKIEMAKAREELKDEIVDLTISMTGKVIEEKLSEDGERKLVEDFLKGIEKK